MDKIFVNCAEMTPETWTHADYIYLNDIPVNLLCHSFIEVQSYSIAYNARTSVLEDTFPSLSGSHDMSNIACLNTNGYALQLDTTAMVVVGLRGSSSIHRQYQKQQDRQRHKHRSSGKHQRSR